ncbi:MAG: hypothetical protein HC901_04635 [Bdellovibrionaceae bacterium]|nr:hypothetical protein [Pseudobdellovibrionaceae bacterium]
MVRHVPQPWRGLIDVGVVLGLLWGLCAVLVFSVHVARGLPFHYPADLPGEDRPAPPAS